MRPENPTIAVVGLAYVGLPLAAEFGKKFKTIGYDLSAAKVAAYREFKDPTGEVASEDLRAAAHLECTTDPSRIASADFIVVAVPTPVDEAHQPDFSPLVSSSTSVGKHMKRGAIVVYESTVYPGATEDVCITVLEKNSGFKWKQDFHVGYSPERINPGDKEHTLTKILKVVSGDDADTLEKVAQLYESVVTQWSIALPASRSTKPPTPMFSALPSRKTVPTSEIPMFRILFVNCKVTALKLTSTIPWRGKPKRCMNMAWLWKIGMNYLGQNR
jgi:UDP-N-acetyl-D-galactosamine dehydrogenase